MKIKKTIILIRLIKKEKDVVFVRKTNMVNMDVYGTDN